MKHDEPRRLDIELFFAGELDASQADELQKHLDSCPVCFNYLQELRREKNEFLSDHPFESFYSAAKPADNVLPWYKQLFSDLLRPSLLPVYGMLLIAAIVVPVITRQRQELSDDIRFKGKPPLTFIYKRDGVVHEGTLSEVFRENDQIQILYSSDREQYIALLSIDSKGAVSFYQPDENSVLCSIKSGTGSNLSYPESIVLDNTKGGELVIALFSREPLTTEGVKTWISDLFSKTSSLEMLEKKIRNEKTFAGTTIATLLLAKG